MTKKKKPRKVSRANRVMPSNFDEEETVQRISKLVPLESRLHRRLMERLLILSELEPSRGSHERRDPNDPLEIENKSQRDFLDRLAYLCSFHKGGKGVVAIAFESSPQGLVVWCAANSDDSPILEAIKEHIYFILRELERSGPDPALASEAILEASVERAQPRLRTYVHSFQSECTNLKNLLDTVSTSAFFSEFLLCKPVKVYSEADLRGQSHFYALENAARGQDYFGIVQSAREFAKSGLMGPFFRDLTDGSMQNQRGALDRLSHLIGRLGAHSRSVDQLVDAAQKFYLKDAFWLTNFSVETVPSSEPIKYSLKETLVGEIRGRLTSDPSHIAHTAEDFDRWMALRPDLQQTLERGRVITTQVHAELLLIDHFTRNECKSFGDDRYFACSKPACYCCRLYILELNKYTSRDDNISVPVVEPATHNNVWLNWRPPDVREDGDVGQKLNLHRKKIVQGMVESIRNEVFAMLSNRVSLNGRRHPDSTAGRTVSTLDI